MRLLILDNSFFPINFETEEFIRQLGDKVTVYSHRKDLTKNYWFDKYIKNFELQNFIEDQKNFDAVYITRSEDVSQGVYKIPYFYNIYKNTYSYNVEANYQSFQHTYSSIKGASKVFVNDRRLNKFSNWLGLDSYFINRPVNTNKFKFNRNRRFLTPKLNIGIIPSSNFLDKENPRNKIFEDIYSCMKSNWILHIPDGRDLSIGDNNVVKYKVLGKDKPEYDYSEIFLNSHVIINPEKNDYTGLDYSHEGRCFEAMATGCVSIHPNLESSCNDYMFDKVHYLKMDFIDSNTILNILRYADKRRNKIESMSYACKDLISKYYDVRKIVQQKIQIIKNSL